MRSSSSRSTSRRVSSSTFWCSWRGTQDSLDATHAALIRWHGARDSSSTINSLRSMITRLRRQLGTGPQRPVIETEPRLGYRANGRVSRRRARHVPSAIKADLRKPSSSRRRIASERRVGSMPTARSTSTSVATPITAEYAESSTSRAS